MRLPCRGAGGVNMQSRTPWRLSALLVLGLLAMLVPAAGCGDFLGPSSNDTAGDGAISGRTTDNDGASGSGAQPADDDTTIVTDDGDDQKPRGTGDEGTPPAPPEDDISNSPVKDDPTA